MPNAFAGIFRGFGRRTQRDAQREAARIAAAAMPPGEDPDRDEEDDENDGTAGQAAAGRQPVPGAAANPPANAVRGDRERIAAIVQAAGPERVETALALALNTDLTVEAAAAVLATVPAAAASAPAVPQGPTPPASAGALATYMAGRSPAVAAAAAPGQGASPRLADVMASQLRAAGIEPLAIRG